MNAFSVAIRRLTPSPDPVGIASEFRYKAGTRTIDELITPYGSTLFDFQPLMNGATETGKVLTVTDPRNRVSKYERRFSVNASEFGAEPEPWPGALASRTGPYTLYWRAKAAEEPGGMGSIANAVAMQWSPTSRGVVSYKEPGINRQWGAFLGGLVVGVREADSISQVTSVHPTSGLQTVHTISAGTTVDGRPMWLDDGHGRTLSYAYHPNTTDLHTTTVAGPGGSNPVVLETLTNYDALHRPLTTTGVDGTSTSVTYNA